MKLDRLLSRIRAALQDYASEFEQRAIAAEYAEACAVAARRLEQIVPLIRGGQNYPALQIAEAAPPVLDVIRQLSFAEAEQWRAFCRQRGLPTAQPFDEQGVELVNQLYGKKISETHPFYREYRQAIRTRHEDDALRVLYSIRRVNPDDANAHAEIARLSRKVFERKSVELASLLNRKDTPGVLALMETIEADNLPGRDQNPAWQRALRLREQQQLDDARARCLALAPQLRELREANRWQDCLPLLAEWDTLRSQYELTFPPEIEEPTTAIRDWAAVRLANREHEEDLRRHWQALASRLEQLERAPANRPTKTLLAQLSDLETEAGRLTAQANATDGSTPPPPDLLRRLEQETSILRQLLRRRRLTRTVLIGTAFAALAAVSGFFVWKQIREKIHTDETASIRLYLQQENADALADALKEFDRNFPDAATDPKLADLLKQARAFAQTHQAARADFDQNLSHLTTAAAAAELPPSQITALLDKVESLGKQTDDLAPDQASRAKVALQNLRQQLEDRLAHTQKTRADTLAGIVNRIQKLLDEKLSAPAENVAPVITDAQKILAEAAQIAPDDGPLTPGEESARTQLGSLGQKLSSLADAARDAVSARQQLIQAHSLDDYRSALESLGNNILPGDPWVLAAHALAAQSPDWANMAQHIFLPGDPDDWNFLQTIKDARLQPAQNDQGEGLAFMRIVQNPELGNVYRADLVEYAEGAATKHSSVLLAGEPTQDVTKGATVEQTNQKGIIIKSDGSMAPITTTLVQFEGQQARGNKFENIQPVPGSKLINRLTQAYDARLRSIRDSLLRVLDDIRADPDASPILKAYFEQEIFAIIQKRPRDWGLAFAPSAQTDATELAKITGGSLQPLDWLFPHDPHLSDNLQAFFHLTSSHAYYDEAENKLTRLLHLRSTPLHFAGYVDLEQKTHLLDAAPSAASLWGLDSSGNWRVLYEIKSGQLSRPTDAPAPARLTPLVYTTEN